MAQHLVCIFPLFLRVNMGLEVKDGLILHISFICIFPFFLQVNMGLEIINMA